MFFPDGFDLVSFSVTIDGVPIPDVIEISALKGEVEKVTYQQQDSTGTFVTRQMLGRKKVGEFKIKRRSEDSRTIRDWLQMEFQGYSRH